jgi:hypothetical protein
MARNSIITKYDWAQDPSVDITGGAWEGQLPAVNMLTLQPQLVAQVVGTSVSFTINLGASRSVGLIHLQRLVTDSSGTIQVTAGSYDSGVVNSWATDLVGVYPPLLYAALGRTRVFIPPVPVTTSSVSFTINAAVSPLQIGYVGVCEIEELPGNMLIGNVRSIVDESSIDQTPFGSTYVTLRARRRRLDFGVGGLSESNGDEVAMSDLSLVNGRSSPVVVAKFPDDTYNLERNTIWGLMTNDQPFTNSFYGHCDATFQITQLV